METVAVAIVVVVVGVFGIALTFREARAKRRQVRKAVAGREPLTAQEFFERHFQADGIPFSVVSGVRRILEEHLDADLSRLAASDDFSTNLNFFWRYDSMADVEIVLALEKEFGIEIADAEAAAARTVRDIVGLVWSKKKQAELPAPEGRP